MIRGAVLEGCSGVGKTSLLKAVKRRQAQLGPERSVVVLSEHFSQALQKTRGGYEELSLAEHRQLLAERLGALESLQAWAARAGDASRDTCGVFFLLERFHLNHRTSFPEDAEWSAALESRLGALGAVCFLLTASPAVARERLVARRGALRQSEIPSFADRQRLLLRASQASRLRTVVLATDDGDWERCAAAVLAALDLVPPQ